MSKAPIVSSGHCSEFTRASLLRSGVAQAGCGLPPIETGMPLPAGTGLSRRSFVLRSAGLALTVFGAQSLAPRGFEEGIAAAAAAGLFVGVAVGASYQYGAHRGILTETLARQTTAPRLMPAGTRGMSPAQVAADDAFLSDLETALERPHTRELLAFDALTPHVREVSNR
jgi:hypothetical protein